MSIFNPNTLTLREMAGLLRRGVLTSVNLLEFYLQRIAERNPQINALIQLESADELRRQAREADEMARIGNIRGPLHGIPMTIKDVCHVRGFRMSRGLEELLGAASQEDATVVARLREAGAIILGITNVPELCMAFETDNLLYGRTLNPCDPQRSAGGSSGGEAAAIAAGCSPAGLASDACGSVRIPAHFNGICGLKLTQGRVPLTGQFPNDRSGLFHLTSAFGVMGRYVDDLELLGQLISGADGHDPDTVDVPFNDSKPLAELRVALSWESARTEVSPALKQVLQQVEACLGSVVADVTSTTPPMLDEASDVLWRVFITGADAGRSWKKLFASMNKQTYTPATSELIRLSEEVELSVDEMKRDWIMIDTFRYQLAQFFNQHDLFICPVFPDVAFAHGESLLDRDSYAFVFPFSLSGSPAVVIRAGHDPVSGMPIGIQIIGPHWQEKRLLTVANFLEREMTRWSPVNPVTQ
ncbi:amidase [Pseudomonas cannabina]|uniref:Amidase n=1 Tax=Pseudomonas cannabina TaxID=86840 RepID=A0A3M3RV39_PSECA|nr:MULTISPECIES: amidase [Pseudomonas syringae group]KPB72988.1 Amidase [Pseudomonas syringae pv. maculicola]KPW15783.1 Amidase [Pseudomonas cannabina pv. alisalensis]RMN74904.1 Amidase [Pseudomonas cannabina]RMN80661.1 Amidase [Pseudomonas cannabina pv. alisalensis]RMO00277.1 Amidase [Pseudomonas cannabina]